MSSRLYQNLFTSLEIQQNCGMLGGFKFNQPVFVHYSGKKYFLL